MRTTTPGAAPGRTALVGVLTLVVVPVLTTLLVVLGPAGEARALSCAGWPSDDPVAMYATRLAPDAPHTEVGVPDRWDGAVVGTVTDLRGAGPVDVVVDVDATLGPRLGEHVVLESPDPGLMSGYAFEAGRRYVIPYVVEDGALHSFTCDPILPVADDQLAPLLAATREGDWAGHVHRLHDAPAPEAATGDDVPRAAEVGTDEAGTDEAPSSGAVGPVGAGALLGGAVTGGVVVLGLARRRHSSGR